MLARKWFADDDWELVRYCMTRRGYTEEAEEARALFLLNKQTNHELSLANAEVKRVRGARGDKDDIARLRVQAGTLKQEALAQEQKLLHLLRDVLPNLLHASVPDEETELPIGEAEENVEGPLCLEGLLVAVELHEGAPEAGRVFRPAELPWAWREAGGRRGGLLCAPASGWAEEERLGRRAAALAGEGARLAALPPGALGRAGARGRVARGARRGAAVRSCGAAGAGGRGWLLGGGGRGAALPRDTQFHGHPWLIHVVLLGPDEAVVWDD
jgi:hypothetical protein